MMDALGKRPPTPFNEGGVCLFASIVQVHKLMAFKMFHFCGQLRTWGVHVARPHKDSLEILRFEAIRVLITFKSIAKYSKRDYHRKRSNI